MPRIGIGVGPSQVILGVDGRSGSFSVYNAGDSEQTFSASAFDFTVDSSGRKVPAVAPLPLGAAAWLTVEPAMFTLQPQETQVVDFVVTVPDDAPPGDHYAGIRILSTMSDGAWAALEPRLVGGVVVRSQVAFPVTVVARVPGEVLPRVVVPPFEIATGPLIASISGDVFFSPQIVNDGNVAAVWQPASDATTSPERVVPTLKLTSQIGFLAADQLLYASAGGGADSAQPASVLVLPGAALRQQLVVRDAPMFGMYEYVYTLPGDVADGRPSITSTGHFMIINLQKILLYLVLPLMLLMVLVAALLFRRHRRQARLQAASTQHQLQLAAIRAEALDQARREIASPDGLPR